MADGCAHMGDSGQVFGLRWTINRQPGLVTVAVDGELDLAAADELEKVLLSLVEKEPVTVIDLEKLGFMDSTGLRLFGVLHRTAQQRGNRFLLGRASLPVRRVLNVSGLVDFFEYVEGAPPAETLCKACDSWVAGDSPTCPNCNSPLLEG